MSHDPQNAKIGRGMANHIKSTFCDRFWASILFLGVVLSFLHVHVNETMFFLKHIFLVSVFL